MELTDLPWLDEPTPEIEEIPPKVKRASGGNLTNLSLLVSIGADLAFHYARAIQYARKHGTPHDYEVLSAWGRKHHDLIIKSLPAGV